MCIMGNITGVICACAIAKNISLSSPLTTFLESPLGLISNPAHRALSSAVCSTVATLTRSLGGNRSLGRSFRFLWRHRVSRFPHQYSYYTMDNASEFSIKDVREHGIYCSSLVPKNGLGTTVDACARNSVKIMSGKLFEARCSKNAV